MSSSNINLLEYSYGSSENSYSNKAGLSVSNEVIVMDNDVNDDGKTLNSWQEIDLLPSFDQEDAESNGSSVGFRELRNVTVNNRDFSESWETILDMENPEDMTGVTATEAPELVEMTEASRQLSERACDLKDYSSSATIESTVHNDPSVANSDIESCSSMIVDTDEIRTSTEAEEAQFFLYNKYTGEKTPLDVTSISGNQIMFLDPRAQDPKILALQMDTKEGVDEANRILKSDISARMDYKEIVKKKSVMNHALKSDISARMDDKEMKEIVGKAYTKFITNHLNCTMTIKVAAKSFSWNGNKGRHGKTGFKHYEQCKVLLEIVDEHPEYSKLSQEEKEKPIKDWFRNAPSSSNKQSGTKRPSKNTKPSKTAKRPKKQ